MGMRIPQQGAGVPHQNIGIAAAVMPCAAPQIQAPPQISLHDLPFSSIGHKAMWQGIIDMVQREADTFLKTQTSAQVGTPRMPMLNIPDKQIEMMFDSYDMEGSGILGAEKIKALLRDLQCVTCVTMSNQKDKALQEARAELTMTMGPQMAAIMSGTVSQMMDFELQMVKQISMQEVTDEECNAMIKDLDADRDGIVSKHDFLINAKKTLFDPNPPQEIMQAIEAIEAVGDSQPASNGTPVRMLADGVYEQDTNLSMPRQSARADSAVGSVPVLQSGVACLYQGQGEVQQEVEVLTTAAMSSTMPIPTSPDVCATSPKVRSESSDARGVGPRVVRVASKERGDDRKTVRALPDKLSESRRYVQSPERHCARRYLQSPERHCVQSLDRRCAKSPERRYAQPHEPFRARGVPAAIWPQSLKGVESTNVAAKQALRASAQVPAALRPVQCGIATRLQPTSSTQATILVGGNATGSMPSTGYAVPGVAYARSVSRGPPGAVRPGSSSFQNPGARAFR
jgi:Ca2+-binding EF-hand superfamily protein